MRLNRTLVALFLLACSQTVYSSYIDLGDCKFALPDGLYITAGSIRSSEVALTAEGNPLRRIVFKPSSDQPIEKRSGEISVSILEKKEYERYSYFRLSHQFSKGSPAIVSVVLIVGEYSVQILGPDKEVWQDYLTGCD